MKNASVLLMAILLMISVNSAAQSFTVTIPATDGKFDLIAPMKATATYQFQVLVKNTGTQTYTVSVDKPGMLPLDTWVTIDNNSQSLAPGSTGTFLLTLTIPAGKSTGE